MKKISETVFAVKGNYKKERKVSYGTDHKGYNSRRYS